MSLKQEILLYSDATFFDELRTRKYLACGAGIIKFPHEESPSPNSKKLLQFFYSENPIQAEIQTGVTYIRYILQHSEGATINWYCDLPYLENLIIKDQIQSSFSTIRSSIEYLKELHEGSQLNMRTPWNSMQIRHHNLCHRACRMAREIFAEINSPAMSTEEINEQTKLLLNKRQSRWEVYL